MFFADFFRPWIRRWTTYQSCVKNAIYSLVFFHLHILNYFSFRRHFLFEYGSEKYLHLESFSGRMKFPIPITYVESGERLSDFHPLCFILFTCGRTLSSYAFAALITPPHALFQNTGKNKHDVLFRKPAKYRVLRNFVYKPRILMIS